MNKPRRLSLLTSPAIKVFCFGRAAAHKTRVLRIGESKRNTQHCVPFPALGYCRSYAHPEFKCFASVP